MPNLIELAQACQACSSMRFSHVLGASNGLQTARVMFVGEAPGRYGAVRSGVPFCGDAAGRRFEELLTLAGLSRDEVFVTNALLCNPLDVAGNNRRPLIREVARCLPFLQGQIDAIDPAIVVALGGIALDALARIERHGATLRADCARAIDWYGRRLIPLYHPGRRALVHRSDADQRLDWLSLRDIVHQAVPSPCQGEG